MFSKRLKNIFSSSSAMTKILFRAVVEVLGKPKEHVESTIKQYVDKLKQDPHHQVVHEERAEIKKQDHTDLWTIFTELEIRTEKMDHLIDFCFDYMPSVLEIIEPEKLTLSDVDVSTFLNDLQAKLHAVDMVAKEVKMENDVLRKSTAALLQNYVRVLLSKGDLTAEQLSKLTGVTQDKLEDFLDALIDNGTIDLKKGIYSLRKKE